MPVVVYRLATGGYFWGVRVWALFNRKAALFVAGRKGLLQQMAQTLAGDARRRIWVHCASLGEFEQGRPVMDMLRRQYPDHALLITFFSPSGYEVRKTYSGADYVFYLPNDSPGNARQFLDIVKPICCLFIKYELWYYYLSTINERQIPVFLVSAVFNKEQSFFKWYGSLQRQMLHCFSEIFVQDEHSLKLLATVGIQNVVVSGDTRFDRVIKVSKEDAEQDRVKAFCAGATYIMVAGSTWKPDEELLQATFRQLPATWKLVLAPHEVGESRLNEIEQLFEGNVVRWSNGSGDNRARVLLVDTVGILSQLYRFGNVAYVGGGFGKDGVHNVLEAAVYAVPVLFGPVYHQFLEASELIAVGGAEVVSTSAELFAALSMYDKDPSVAAQAGEMARNYVVDKGGATQKVMQGIGRVLSGF